MVFVLMNIVIAHEVNHSLASTPKPVIAVFRCFHERLARPILNQLGFGDVYLDALIAVQYTMPVNLMFREQETELVLYD